MKAKKGKIILKNGSTILFDDIKMEISSPIPKNFNPPEIKGEMELTFIGRYIFVNKTIQ